MSITTDILRLIQDGHLSPAQGRDLLNLLVGSKAQASRPAHDPTGWADIAIVGMAGRFPGANDTDAFWDNLSAGRNSVIPIPPARWDSAGFYDPDRTIADKSYSKWAGLLDDITGFDADFFNISPREALLMDPQQRLFLQESWCAIEHAGYAPDSWANVKCGAFVGCVTGDYLTHLRDTLVPTDAYSLTGNTASILAGRLSYFLNLKGPAVAVDTACSSSLVAVHMAAESLSSGTCDVALAGGVMLFSTPALFVQASRLGMLSPDGQCKTFDDRANGIVLSESVGVVVLKRLSDAQRDGDTIHAVIRGSGINQDGKTPGITVPSAYAQAALIAEVQARAGVHPETVGYIEAHGTGTRLGDPIELEALTAVFREQTAKKQFCAIGSVKTNIGHAQIAAGITALIKTVLCLSRKTLPPSLHLQQPNQLIDFANSPFHTIPSLQQWAAPTAHPRRAGVTALGFSGTNAHLVLEEYVDDRRAPRTSASAAGQVLVLSARTPERLRAYAERWCRWLRTTPELPSFADLVYTLQVGRSAMNARLALICSTLDEIEIGLQRFLDGERDEALFVGREQASQLSSAELEQAPLRPGTCDDAVRLARAWVADMSVDWAAYHQAGTVRRVPVPSYPFADERYWPASKPSHLAHTGQPAGEPSLHESQGQLHPILATDLSTTDRPRFGYRFTREDVYLKDHIVDGAPTLLGVSHLEMAVAAEVLSRHARAASHAAPAGQLTQIRGVAWRRPVIVIDQPKFVQIELESIASGLAYRVGGRDEAGKDQLYSQGRLRFVPAPAQRPVADLRAIKARCATVWPAADCYRVFDRNELIYGPGLRTLETLYWNESESLARLILPTALRHDLDAYTLHPSLMDGALQSLLGLLGDPSADGRLYIPYALNEITVYAPLTAHCYAHARVAGNHAATEFAEKRFDIDIVDDDGCVLAALRDLSYRPYSRRKKSSPHLFEPVWSLAGLATSTDLSVRAQTVIFSSPVTPIAEFTAALGQEFLHVVLVHNGHQPVNHDRSGRTIYLDPESRVDWEMLVSRFNLGEVLQLLFLPDAYPDGADSQGGALLRSLYLLLQTMRDKKIERARLLCVTDLQASMGGARQLAIAGFARVLRQEQAGMMCSVLALQEPLAAESVTLIARELRAPSKAGETLVQYRHGVRLVRRMERLSKALPSAQPGLFRQGGTYLITGGAGALGMHIAAELRRRYAARVVVCGRSAPERVAHAISGAEQQNLPGVLRYVQADVSNANDVERLGRIIRSECTHLNGILHAAGTLRDSLVAKQDLATIESVVGPKVRGAMLLDEMTKSEPLDFLILFSSISSLAGSIGQASYAYANEFLDHFSSWRNGLRDEGRRAGKTLSINWPYWRDGGMRISEQGEILMKSVMGVEPLSLAHGFDVLFGVADTDPSSLCVAAGDFDKIAKAIGAPVERSAAVKSAATPALNGVNGVAMPAFHTALCTMAEDILQRPARTIRPETSLADYGFDSITYVEFANCINRAYDIEVTPALFFEHTTVAALASFLDQEHGLTGRQTAPEASNPASALAVSAADNAQDSTTVQAETRDRLEATLRALAGDVLKRNSSTFNVTATLDSYGFDSITYVELANKLNLRFDIDVTPALFFEHKTLSTICTFLTADYRDAVASALLDVKPEAAVVAPGGGGNMSGEAAPALEQQLDVPRAHGAQDRLQVDQTVRQVGAATREAPVVLSHVSVPPRAAEKGISNVEPIAIIGMAGVLPDSPDLEQFWAHLAAAHDLISEVPADRWSWQSLYGDPAESGKTRAKWGGFIADVDKFDSLYFNISPHEAKLMDPAQRIVLEVVFNAIGNAGYATADLAGSNTAVFMGVGALDYLNLLVDSGQAVSAYSSTGLSHSVLASRISYLLDLHGPSQPVDTACSSSLIALHRAVEAMRHHGCEMAIAGGVNLMLSPFLTLSFSDAGMLSNDGRCKTFSRQANGYVRGEGAGAVLLKPLAKALSDGDTIHAVIRATAENHGGRASSLTAPNPVAQAALLVDAYTRAGLDPTTITYIETHGTGTPLGDPIEINGLKSAFATLSERHGASQYAHRCGLGSVKTNIGHLEAAAGMAGLFKVVLSMQHGMLPATLHFDEVNPFVRLDGSPFYIVDRLQPWDMLRDQNGNVIPRRAGVSSLSFSGANAHVVLEEYIETRTRPTQHGEQLILLSARNRDRLMESARRLASQLETTPNLSLAELAYTLQVGRDQLNDRLAIVVPDSAALSACLREVLAGRLSVNGVVRLSPDVGVTEDEISSVTTGDDANWQQALVARDLVALAGYWTAQPNVKIDWRALPRASNLRRVPLPTYPFERIRHWAIEPRVETVKHHPQALVGIAEQWRPAPLPGTHQAVTDARPSVLLCCLSDTDRQTQLAELVAAQMPSVRLLFLSRYPSTQTQTNCYSVNVDRPEQLAEVCQRIVATHGEIEGLIYLWPLEEAGLVDRLEVFVAVLQALCRGYQAPARVLLAGASWSAIDRCRLESWLGLERSTRQTLPETELFTVILGNGMSQDAASAHNELERMLREWRAANSRSVLYDGNERLQLSRERVALPAPRADAALPSARAKTWLITGGSGHLGLLFAAYLAKTHGAAVRLALTGRSRSTPELEQQLDGLRAHGAQVRYFQADVTDRVAMKTAVDEARAIFGPFDAFLHAAGVEEGPSLLEASTDEFRSTLAPKVAGVEILDALTADDPLVYACYFGSIAGLLGDMGAASYSVANRFLMAHALYRNELVAQRKRQGRTLCIGWPLWQEGGMGPVQAVAGSDQANGLALYLESSGLALMSTDLGLTSFEALLGSDLTQLALLCGDESRLERLLMLTPAVVAGSHEAAAGVAAMSAPDQPAPGSRELAAEVDLMRPVLQDLKALASELSQLPVEALESHATLNTFGFDSISLSRLAKKMQERFELPVTPAMFFSYPTLSKLTKHLVNQHRVHLAARYVSHRAAPEAAPAASSPATDGGQRLHDISLEPIAIIGASGRFPQADSIDKMWQILLNGQDAVTGDNAPPGYFCGSMRGVGEFDPLFFGITPRAAEEMDPRQRLLLEESWRALEHAAIGPGHLASMRVGVFVGLEEGEYFQLGGGGAITAHHSAITAAHLAYLLDFDGPVMTINTACSSGLVALHQACQSLRLKECEMALVSSASLMLTEMSFTRLNDAGILSADGRCRTFDQRANGIVPGEAVAALVIKPLAAALAAGDSVLAVIAGSQINYDGKTNGITAPSGAAQVKLLQATYAACGLSPAQIDYVVTHGTGTSLGDAVEINALAEVFGKSVTGPRCALTSTKTNFGHTLAASGLVSTLCLLSALRHGVIPPSLHFETPNDFVDWNDSAFFVNTAARLWPADAQQPRYGAVSAFGMSGTNAHVVLRDLAVHERPVKQRFRAAPAYLLPLSARSISSLCDRAQQLIDFLAAAEPALDLAAMSYTLFEGRHHFDYRCAVIASDRAAAIDVLQRLLAARLLPAKARSGKDDELPLEVFEGQAFLGKSDQHQVAQPTIEKMIEGLVRQLGDDLVDSGNVSAPAAADSYQDALRALADFYRQGYALPWHLRYPQRAPLRHALPTYPFEHQHYWVQSGASVQPARTVKAQLHPLLHNLKQDGASRWFVSSFSGQERFFTDHVIHGSRMLPGVAYLEMALAATEQTISPSMRARAQAVSLSKIGWAAPFVWSDGERRVLQTRLTPLSGGDFAPAQAFSFTIASRLDDGDVASETVHCQGVVSVETPTEHVDTAHERLLDIAGIQARYARVVDGAACYHAFQVAGLAYGDSFRVIEAVHCASDTECVALLRLPVVGSHDELAAAMFADASAEDSLRYVLYPALVDGALQAVAGCFLQAADPAHRSLPSRVPFALDRIDVFGPTSALMWAHLTIVGEGAVRKVNADIHDEGGRLRVRLTGLSAREIAPERVQPAPELIQLSCQWQDDERADSHVLSTQGVEGRRHLLFLGVEGQTQDFSSLAYLRPGVQSETLSLPISGTDSLSLARDFRAAAATVFERVKAYLASGAKQDPLFIQIVIVGWPGNPLMLALDGLLKTAEQENPQLRGQVVAVDSLDPATMRRIVAAASDPERRAIWLDRSRRKIAVWSVAPEAGDAADSARVWKAGACYLITGGAGKLGRIFAQDIVASVPGVRVVLVGRSLLDEADRQALAVLARQGGQVEYYQADITDYAVTTALVAAIEATYGRLDGVIHCAGLIADNFIVNKSVVEFERVLAPKVMGVACLDHATRHLVLDMFLLCASASGVTGNVGQGDYATANAFLDGFAHYRNSLVERGERHGHTLSVDWSLWAEGGMRPDPQTEERLWTAYGIRPLGTRAALAAMHMGLRRNCTQMLVAEGNRSWALARFQLTPPPAMATVPQSSELTAPGTGDMLVATVEYFKQLLADIFGLPTHRINEQAALEEYGIDSIMVVRLTAKLETIFGPLSKTLFFEYKTLAALCGHFVEHHAAQLAELLDMGRTKIERALPSVLQAVPELGAEATANSALAAPSGALLRPLPVFNAADADGAPHVTTEFAIIGLSGQYPQAADLDEYWQNLRTGRDCITEIPRERWNHDRYFSVGEFRPGMTYGKWGGFMSHVDCFDTVFFNISPREAELLDPQERLFLQCVYHVLEDAGYTRLSIAAAARRRNPGSLVGQVLDSAAVGVFVGAMYNEYQLYGAEQTALGYPLAIPGNVASIANRVSYFCNFHGPSVTLDTMCSSSLSAIHMACHSIAAGECAFAVAGGVNVTVHPNKYLVLGQGRFLSEDGRCRSFGEGGSGYVPGEGVGAVLIRPLADALADGDLIHGVICASSINHGGKTNGYSVPNPNAQAALIQEAMQRARIEPGAISYIEAHGTGTALGDPIEMSGLKRAFAARADAPMPCAIGSVKSNIGHCESAAGIAGLTKVLLQFRHRLLVPSLHAEELNRNIDFGQTPFRVQRNLADWIVPAGTPRIAAISSFGAGGSNAHLIVREHVDTREPLLLSKPAGGVWLIPLSARTPKQLLARIEQLLAGIEAKTLQDLAGLAYTLQVGREAMRERLGFAVSSLTDLERHLRVARDHWPQIEAQLADLSAALTWREPAGNAVLYRAKATGAHPLPVNVAQDDAAVLHAWVGGAVVDWAERYLGAVPRKVRLPLYPYAKERYWAPIAIEAGDAMTPPQPTTDNMILERTWQRLPREAGQHALGDPVGGTLLILCTPSTKAIARSLFADTGSRVDTLYVVHGADTPDPLAIPVDFDDENKGRAAYAEFVKRLVNRPLGVIDVTALDAGHEASSAFEAGKISLLQAFLMDHRQQAPSLLQVTHRLQAWHGETTLQGARTAGLYRMLGAEYRTVRSGVMDTDEDLRTLARLKAQIEHEFGAGPVTECCYRDGERFVPAMRPLAGKQLDMAGCYRPDDVILITGGTGGIGAAVAEHVAAAGVRALAIVGRERLPEATQWPQLLAAGGTREAGGRTLEKIRHLQSLVERGVRVHYEACSFDSDDSIAAAVASIEVALGAVTGVFHCAGLTSADPAFIRKPVADIAMVCAPKMTGLAALHARIKRDRLRFFMLFSSVSALLPQLAAGQSDYAMANAYMDYFAQHCRTRGEIGVCSLQWPAWAETGMATDNASPALSKTGLQPILTQVGLSLLDRCVAIASAAGSPAVCLPCQVDLARFDPDQLVAVEPAPVRQDTPVVTENSASRGAAGKPPPLVSPASSLLGALENWMRQMLIDELKFSAEQVADRDVPFADYGIESVMVLQLIDRMSKLTGSKLDPSLMLEFDTLGALCEHLLGAHEAALSRYFTAPVAVAPDPLAVVPPGPATSRQATPGIEPVPERAGDIAIIGLAVRLPGAPDAEEFWQLQMSGQSAITPMRDERWPGGRGQVQAGWLDDIDSFDPTFFGLHASDVAVMDPQARLMMEESLQALHDAGYAHGELSARPVGVYIGGRLQVTADQQGLAAAVNPILGVGQNYLASNISRFFNFTGPSMVVDTACSSGLTAMSIAFDALRSGSIDMALVGTTSLLTTSQAHDLFSARNILSPDGTFRIFDSEAAGDVLGEGVIALVCKTRAQAEADGDRVYAVVKALAVNNDGRTLGPGSPSLKAQRDVMRRALAQAGKTAGDIGYIEVNGGGSAVVDAVEIKALAQVYQFDDNLLGACPLGSVKPSVGHLLLSSGLAGFVRCALSLYHQQIPPSLCAMQPFEHYDFAASRAQFNRQALAWETPAAGPRVAAQSCFPDGGTNCHLILEEFVPAATYVQRRHSLPLPALRRQTFARATRPQSQPAPISIAAEKGASNVVYFPIQSSWGTLHEKSL